VEGGPEEAQKDETCLRTVLMKRSTIARAKMGFSRHRKSIKSSTRIGRKFAEGEIILITPSLIDLMSFGWLFLGGLLPSRARLRFTSYQDCATLEVRQSKWRRKI
jgi:hypothetical protein